MPEPALWNQFFGGKANLPETSLIMEGQSQLPPDCHIQKKSKRNGREPTFPLALACGSSDPFIIMVLVF